MPAFENSWNFWLTVMSLIIAVIAIFVTLYQGYLSNKQALFDRRLSIFIYLTSLIKTYELSQKNILNFIQCKEPYEPEDYIFLSLTNNSNLEDVRSCVYNPQEPQKKEVLKEKVNYIKNIAQESDMIFPVSVKEYISSFFTCYAQTLNDLYHVIEATDILKNDLINNVMPKIIMTNEQKQDYFNNKHYRCLKSLKELDDLYKQIIKNNVLTKIKMKTKLIWR